MQQMIFLCLYTTNNLVTALAPYNKYNFVTFKINMVLLIGDIIQNHKNRLPLSDMW